MLRVCVRQPIFKMIPQITFLLPLINFLETAVHFLSIQEDDEILNIHLLINCINIISIIANVVIQLDLFIDENNRDNDIYKLLKLCDDYR